MKGTGRIGGGRRTYVRLRWVPADWEQNKVLGYRWTVFDRVLGGALPNRGSASEVLERWERARC